MQPESAVQSAPKSSGKTIRPAVLAGAVILLLVGLLIHSTVQIHTLRVEFNRLQTLLHETTNEANKNPLEYEKGYQDAIWEKYIGKERYRIELDGNNSLSIWQKKPLDPARIQAAQKAGLLPKPGELIDELPTP